MDDGELIRAVQRGDRESLTILYRRYVKAVWRYLHAHLGWDRETTDDLVSETFLAAVRNIGTFDPRQGTVNGWLIGIARNKLRDHFRRAERVGVGRHGQADESVDADLRGPDRNLVEADIREAVIRTLDTLTDEERLALEWKYVESLSVREIAKRLGRTEKAVEAILYRARISFRTAYSREQARTA